jgi:hypothetical protein
MKTVSLSLVSPGVTQTGTAVANTRLECVAILLDTGVVCFPKKTNASDFALLLSEGRERRCERARTKCNKKSAAIVHSPLPPLCAPIMLAYANYGRLRYLPW